MGLLEIFILALGLSMDAFAVSLCQGLGIKNLSPKHVLKIGAWYGGFQALMPVIGYLMASRAARYIENYDHWAAFLLLAWIGGSMLRDALSKEEENNNLQDPDLGFPTMLKLALATSIDALAVGVSMACVKTGIMLPAILIGLVTFTLSAMGVSLGRQIGAKAGKPAEFLGGLILVGLGLKILLQHTLFA